MKSDKEMMSELSHNFVQTYTEVKAELGDEFEPIMADLAAEILVLQSKCKEGTPFIMAGLLMMMEDDEEDNVPEELQLMRIRYVKAAIAWYVFEQNGANPK